MAERIRAQDELSSFAAEAHAIREGEKSRIARELHDELGQVLTALKMDLAWVRERLPEGEVAGRVGEGCARITQVANFRGVVKALARNGDERDTGSFKCIFINGKCSGGAEE